MKKFYFTPGPSQLYFTVEEHLKQALKQDIPSISHRSSAYKAIHEACVNGLRQLLKLPDNYHVLFTSSATEAWDRIAQNLIEKESFHFVNGAFSQKFQNIVANYNKSAMSKKVDLGQVVDIDSVLIPETSELIAMTYNETSTGAMHTAADVEKIRAGFPNQLLALDVVSITPSVAIDFSRVDTFYFSVQKCFGLPAGLGVWVVNERCLAKSRALLDKEISIGSYHALPELIDKSMQHQTPETPNILGIYLLKSVIQDMLTKGIEQIRTEINYKAAVLQHMVDQSPLLSNFVESAPNRSKTTLVANTNVPSNKIIEALSEKGLIIGSGYGKAKDQQIRIANFPTHSKEQIELLSDQILALNI